MCMIGVISGYRTGSTTLIEGLSTLFGLDYNPTHTGELDFAHGHYYSPHRDDMIYKFMPQSARHRESELWESIHEDWLSKSQLIFSLRHDVTAQIKSYYLATITGVWHGEMNPIQSYNNVHSTDFKTVADVQTDICMKMNRDTLEEFKESFVQNLQMQNEIYEQYGGVISVLERRSRLDYKPYNSPFVLPEQLRTWESGIILKNHFPHYKY